ncbi:P-loop containing nucleoside triphosphate hydrolase [Trinorchestia longiramus]|nr:P-loop containing nucleoside triphosphate hydrolase [Trinorchestia longiramus]
MMRFHIKNFLALSLLVMVSTLCVMISKTYNRIPLEDRDVILQLYDIELKTDIGMSHTLPLQNPPDDLISTINLNEISPGTQHVLLVSSTPRSGSTFIGELISTHESTVYFFEPLHKIKEDPCVQNPQCLTPYLAEKFTCSFDDDFLTFLKKALFAQFYSNTTRTCMQLESIAKRSCLSEIDYKKECLESNLRFVKVIRARLRDVLPLLELIPDLKIIHLYRDPRGFMNSIKKFKGWDHNSSRFCGDLEQDWLTFNSVIEENTHPHRIIQLSYEDFARNSFARTRSLFKLLFGVPDLEASTLSYLQVHTKSDQRGSMVTSKNSEKAAEAWSESACEREDPGSNPAADMVDAARNTAWDLGKQPNNYRSNYPTQEWARSLQCQIGHGDDLHVGTSGVTDHQVGTSWVTDHQVGTSGVTDHQVETSGVTDHQVGTSGVTDHQVGTSGVTDYQEGTSVYRLSGGDIWGHRSSGGDIWGHGLSVIRSRRRILVDVVDCECPEAFSQLVLTDQSPLTVEYFSIPLRF